MKAWIVLVVLTMGDGFSKPPYWNEICPRGYANEMWDNITSDYKGTIINGQKSRFNPAMKSERNCYVLERQLAELDLMLRNADMFVLQKLVPVGPVKNMDDMVIKAREAEAKGRAMPEFRSKSAEFRKQVGEARARAETLFRGLCGGNGGDSGAVRGVGTGVGIGPSGGVGAMPVRPVAPLP